MKINVIDLFAGCGGLIDGFLQTGNYNTLAAVDWDPNAITTLKKRLADKYSYDKKIIDKKILYFDIQRTKELIYGFNDERYGKSIGLEKIIGDAIVDLIIGGPPCQAYSLAGRVQDKNGMKNDYRNYLFESYVEIVNKFKPKYFVFENVLGILTAKPGNELITERITKAFDKIGYIVPENLRKIALFDTSYFGIPQKRKRVIIFGVRKDLNKVIVNDFYKHMLSYKQNKETCSKEYLSNLPKYYPIKNGKGKISHESKSSHNVLNHFPRYHNSRDISIFRILAEDILSKKYKYSSTQSLKNLYFEKTGNNSNFHKYNVIRLDSPSNTIPAHLHKDGLRHIHPDPKQARSITVREAARLQSFDDDFEFVGSIGSQYKMVGNAVPPKFAKIIAETIKTQFV